MEAFQITFYCDKCLDLIASFRDITAEKVLYWIDKATIAADKQVLSCTKHPNHIGINYKIQDMNGNVYSRKHLEKLTSPNPNLDNFDEIKT